VLKLLLDEHISPEVAKGIRARRSDLSVHALAEWDGGHLLGKPDEVCLEVARIHGLTLLTYDLRTIPPLLKDWHERGSIHAGVIFVDGKTISPSDLGALVRSVIALADEQCDEDWSNRVVFLRT
jgi:hypothetical protein